MKTHLCCVLCFEMMCSSNAHLYRVLAVRFQISFPFSLTTGARRACWGAHILVFITQTARSTLTWCSRGSKQLQTPRLAPQLQSTCMFPLLPMPRLSATPLSHVHRWIMMAPQTNCPKYWPRWMWPWQLYFSIHELEEFLHGMEEFSDPNGHGD